jgi:hypothetical protein
MGGREGADLESGGIGGDTVTPQAHTQPTAKHLSAKRVHKQMCERLSTEPKESME